MTRRSLLVLGVLFLILLVPAKSMARTNFFFNFGLGFPLPIFVAPAPVVIVPPTVLVAPAPVIVAPPVYVQPYRTYYGPPGRYHGKKRGWYKDRW